MYAAVNGTRLYFDVDGAEVEVREGELVKKPVCFVLHGGPGGNHISFKPTFEALTGTMQLIYVDQRGCGFSDDAPEDTLHIDNNVEDLEALRQLLGLEKVWILGHSYGGMVAQAYAKEHGENLAGLLLVTTAPNSTFLSDAKAIVEEKGTPEQVAICEKLWAGDFQSDEELSRFYELMGSFYSVREQSEGSSPRPKTKRNFRALNQGFGGFMKTMDYTKSNAAITVPTLVIAGAHDWITPPVANEAVAASIPGSKYVLFEQSSHRVMFDEYERFMELVKGFVLEASLQGVK
ncbi:alpha/beta fold hydrolase [Geomicrobium sediminis]|uniref:Proline iminopeptidase n=1 Tax=Geomicrobium sediminis TaxID=1347788 RepID=A0ABS2PA29_9BACL|nr:alpha/beta fold hydrolase [Geomicrobium sediminis]MBM7632255.1 proline iminopeptidase [Geomicrobium sediminis]